MARERSEIVHRRNTCLSRWPAQRGIFGGRRLRDEKSRLPTNIVAEPEPMMALKQYATMFREALPVAELFVFKE
jgi:hypothetical protein